MKRSDFFIRLTSGVLFLAVASYIGVYVYNAVINTFVTTTAISYAVEETFPAIGYIVRTEEVVTDAGTRALQIVDDGEKIASGQVIAVEYMSREALETASEIRELRMRIMQLESVDSASVEATSLRGVMALARAVQSGDFSRLDELSLTIGTYIFANPASEAELPALRLRLETLEGRVEDVRTIHAPVSGTFSQIVDGYEHIEPGALAEVTPSRLTELFDSPSAVRGVGKLVTEFRWYYASIMSFEDASRLTTGQLASVQFSGAFNSTVDMFLERVGRGKTVCASHCFRAIGTSMI